jgi:hypothetical protein
MRNSGKCVPNADFHSIMNIKDAENVFWRERRACWGRFTDPKLKRRVQNRINQYVLRWKDLFYLETAEDYYILASEIKDMREGRVKKREGRPRRSGNRSKRRTSQRLAEKRRKLDNIETSEADTLSDSAIDFEFDQSAQVPPSKEDVNFGAGVPAEFSTNNSSNDEFPYILSNEFDRTPESISSSFFDPSGSQAFGQHSNILSLDGEIWCESDDLSNPTFDPRMLHSGTSPAKGKSLQEDVCTRNLQDANWWGDLANFNGLHVLLEDGDKGAEMNGLELKSCQSSVQPSGLTLALVEDPDVQGRIRSGNVDCAYTQSSGVPPPPEKVDSGLQEFDKVQLCSIMVELKSQLRKRLGHSLPKEPIPDREKQPSLTKGDGLGLLIEQCLTTLRGSTIEISGAEKNRTGLENKRNHNRYETGAELQMIVEHLWNAMRAESCRIPPRLF